MEKDNNEKDKTLTSVLNASMHELFLQKKIEKITTALYLLTEGIYKEDPLCIELRKQSVLLLSGGSVLEKTKQHQVSRGLLNLLSLLDVAHGAGIVSTMNWEVVRGEIKKIISFIYDKEAKIGIAIKDEYFTIEEDVFDEMEDTIPAKLPPSHEKSTSTHQTSIVKVTPSSKETKSAVRTRISRTESPSPSERRSKRRETILGLIRRLGNVSVKDIAKHVEGYSEKTLQRELLALVAEGVLKKEGERRWSTYSIAK